MTPGHHARRAAEAIRRLRLLRRWKPGKNIQHLEKRKALGHLPRDASLATYDSVIHRILSGPGNGVFHYPFGRADYYAVSGVINSVPWLVIFSEDGILETAFPPEDLMGYLVKHGFVPLGPLEQILHE